jgi:aryl-alcohol dehydrogenase-like predicted oxidoreductase
MYREASLALVKVSTNADKMQEEREMMPTLQHFGVGCIPWSPLAGGRKFLIHLLIPSCHPDNQT